MLDRAGTRAFHATVAGKLLNAAQPGKPVQRAGSREPRTAPTKPRETI